MSRYLVGHRGARLVVLALALGTLIASALPAIGAAPQRSAPFSIQGEEGRLSDLDARTGRIAPSTAQLTAVKRMGATARWNSFGTPRSLIKHGGFLATGLPANEVDAARQWIQTNRALFRLSSQGVTSLELVNSAPIGAGKAVLFRQRFGGLPAAQDGLLTVGVVNGKVAYVSSSVTGAVGPVGQATISAQDAYRAAAADVGVEAGGVSNTRTTDGWTTMSVEGLSQPQRARLVALPTPSDGVRPVYETIVLDSDNSGSALAYTHFVDAQTGKVWFRQDRVQHLQQGEPTTNQYQGSTGNDVCGPLEPDGNGETDPDPGPGFNVGPGISEIIVTGAASDIVVSDIVVRIVFVPTNTVVAESDTLFSPEVARYAPQGGVPPGVYAAQVCKFNPGDPAIDYFGTYTTSPAGGTGLPYPPKWRVFPNIPLPDFSSFPWPYPSTDTRELWCWDAVVQGVPIPGCDREVQNLASRAPWDHNVRTNTPTFTTMGNNAISGEAWLSPLTPAEQYRPVNFDRNYDFSWQNRWFEEKCGPAAFAPQPGGPNDPPTQNRNDIDAATTNLFGMHNRMHDWSYFLGFTEETFNAQDNNFGNAGKEGDPEIGNSQAGALTGGQPSFQGRDNANQITLNDGIPPITNMYLWQPIRGAFYPPCVDGDYDMSVIGHEYTHLISNRMVGGPDAGLTGPQAGAMGESWSDLSAVEYLLEYGFAPVNGENPFAVGPYVTGDPHSGIRNYGMDFSPLNYSDVGYDITGPQVHADGEIWSAVNYDIRQALIEKYNGQGFPAGDAALQERCADGRELPDECPGNRRWVQILFDAWLLMPPNVSMVDARDAYLAADVMRFGGANQTELWREFARGGVGQFASSNTNADAQPLASFETPVETDEATVTFRPIDARTGATLTNVQIFAGDFEARATPVADTDASTTGDPNDDAVEKFVPGTYNFVARRNGYGHRRFTLTLGAGETPTATIAMARNVASRFQGAVATGDGVNHNDLIDDTEATNWASLGQPVAGRQVTVRLGLGIGSPSTLVDRVQVSAMLRPTDANNPNDSGSQNRFSALRRFEILTCRRTQTVDCSQNSQFTLIFTSAADAFPSIAPRPRAPDLILRSFDVPNTQASHVRIRVLTNQCTGGPHYQGDQDNDPGNDADCDEGQAGGLILEPQHDKVRIAELQVFGIN